MKARIKYVSIITVCLFFMTLTAPLVFITGGFHDPQPNFENRRKASFPSLLLNNKEAWHHDISGYINQCKSYFKDNFAFREYLIDFNMFIKAKVFSSEPLPGKVVHGREGWLFAGDDHSGVMCETMGITRFSDTEVWMITGILLKIRQQLDNQGIKFFMAIAPDKQTVYGQYLPVTRSPLPTKAEQLKESLKQSGFDLIDLKEGFENHQSEMLFYKTDTHWNTMGLFIAYQTLMKRFISNGFPSMKVHKLSDYKTDSQQLIHGDLACMLRSPVKETSLHLVPLFKNPVRKIQSALEVPENYPFDNALYEQRFISDAGNPKMVAFTDSFLACLPSLIDDSFGEMIFIRSVFNMDVVRQEKPDIVLFEIVERNIDDLMGVVTEFPVKKE